MEADEGDGNVIPRSLRRMEVLPWHTLSTVAQVKLLFLLDIGDVTSQDIDNCDNLHVLAPEEARDAFLSVLQGRHHRFERVAAVVRGRVKHLLEYPFISVAAGTEAADLSVRRDDEDLLTLVHACRFLHIECRHLKEKTKKVQEKLDLDDEEMEGNSFIYAENLRMLRICDGLTAQQVAQLVSLTVEDKTLRDCVATGLEVSAAAMEHTEGLKEASFFYLIRSLELGNKLNRIYTNKLEVLLQQLRAQAASEAEKRMLSEAITSLGDYPGGGRPAGYCMVFCVTRGRKGAQAEIDKVKHVFGKSLGYNVNIVENPDREMLQECLRTLQKPKYKFYDSIVYWFMSHGSEDKLRLADDFYIKRQTIIQIFSNVTNFRKKPKIFFMAPCQGSSTIHLQIKRGLLAALDSAESGQVSFSVLPEDCQNITAVYYQMDRLVASATLPQQYAFRLPDGGSVYVDTVCRLMEQHRGHNITQVLECVANTMHQILFACKEKFAGDAKQACCYDSTLQKTFRVP